MNKPNLLVVSRYPQRDIDLLAESYALLPLWQADDPMRFLAERARGIKALATNGEKGASAELMDLLPDLEMIACYGVGVDAIDLAHAWSRSIRVTNTPDVLTGDVADMGIALLLACARQIPKGDAYVRSGQWASGPMGLTRRVFGKRLGIVGLGRVGRAVAKRAVAFDMSIAYCDRVRFADLPYDYHADVVALAAAVDVLMVCASADAQNRGFIGAPVFDALGAEGLLVNIARGSVIDEPALIEYLREKRIAGAALDVFWNEPRIAAEFAALDNVVLQPHQASATTETRAAMGDLVRKNLAAYFAGAPLLTEVKPQP
jgi:D-3-phosphoglycerate dehydrogenase